MFYISCYLLLKMEKVISLCILVLFIFKLTRTSFKQTHPLICLYAKLIYLSLVISKFSNWPCSNGQAQYCYFLTKMSNDSDIPGCWCYTECLRSPNKMPQFGYEWMMSTNLMSTSNSSALVAVGLCWLLKNYCTIIPLIIDTVLVNLNVMMPQTNTSCCVCFQLTLSVSGRAMMGFMSNITTMGSQKSVKAIIM